MSKRKSMARSRCVCGHTGDVKLEPGVKVNESEHLGLIGHGPCRVANCKCVKFTWHHFLSDETDPEIVEQFVLPRE